MPAEAKHKFSARLRGWKRCWESCIRALRARAAPATAKYVDDVALFVFPALALNTTQTNYSNDYCTKGGDPSVPYNFIDVTLTGTPAIPTNSNMQGTAGATNAGTYEIIPFC